MRTKCLRCQKEFETELSLKYCLECWLVSKTLQKIEMRAKESSEDSKKSEVLLEDKVPPG